MNRRDVAQRFAGLNPVARAFLWALIAAVIFAVMDAIVKVLGRSIDSLQIVFFRCVFGALAVLPFLMRLGPKAFATRQPMMHVLRMVTGYTGTACGFYALTQIDLAKVVAISYTRSLFLVALAVLFLGEMVRWRRWTATAIGFLGMLVMVRPGFTEIGPGEIAAITAAVCIAFTGVALKKLTATDPPESIIFWYAVATTILSLPLAIWVWRPLDAPQWIAVIMMGMLGSFGQYCILRAYRLVEATQIEPIDYVRLVFATAIGFFFFAELPDRFTFVGAAIIVASTLYIARREAKLRRLADAKPVG
jgi:drug/metabolite transporter (DMT)-like permease